MKEAIRKALKRKGMTQKELAEALSVTPQAVSKWVTGESRPSSDNIVAINKILGIDLIREMTHRTTKGAVMEKQQKELRDLNSIEKAREEAERILEEEEIRQNYPHHIYILALWLLTATIGLSHHQLVHFKKRDEGEEEPEYLDIFVNLNDYFEECSQYSGYRNALDYSFYILGMDLFESFGEHKMKDHDYVSDSMDCWYNFSRALGENPSSQIEGEFKVALMEILSRHY